MNKNERINNMLKGLKIDRPPVVFWQHFPDEHKFGEASVEAHLKFQKETDVDILKIMNENVFYDGSSKIECLNDIKKFRAFSKKDKIFQDQIELIKKITIADNAQTPTMATIHGVIASAFHETGYPKLYSNIGYMFPLFCRERPQEMKAAFNLIAESLMELAEDSINAGATGIYYALLGAERYYFKDEEYEEFVMPYEKKVYEHIKKLTPLNFLHVCKSNIALERYAVLEPAIANWSVNDTRISLSQGKQNIFSKSIVAGGFKNNSGVLISNNLDEISSETAALCETMKETPFIISADCSVAGNIDRQNIREVVATVNKIATHE